MDIYKPREDSYLLEKVIRSRGIVGRVLDMGTGSGILALAAVENSNVKEVVAVDINEDAVRELKEKAKYMRKLHVIEGDLFSSVSGAFSVVIFNAPYLPQDEEVEDAALYGGKKGWELSERFFDSVSRYLFADGEIYFLFSTLTDKNKIEEILVHRLFEFERVASEKLAFEELFVYRIWKSSLLREMEARGLAHITYYREGKRGVVYTADYVRHVKSHIRVREERERVAVKLENPTSRAIGRIENEVKWLREVNKKGIGPRLRHVGEGYFAMSFVEGVEILDWVRVAEVEVIVDLLVDVLRQCRVLDEMGITKEEMHRPHKHILVQKVEGGVKGVLLDFERCRRSESPQNVTQFVEFISRMSEELSSKGLSYDAIHLRELSREYKDTYGSDVFCEIERYLERKK